MFHITCKELKRIQPYPFSNKTGLSIRVISFQSYQFKTVRIVEINPLDVKPFP